jgi:hypothetical protein
VFFAAKAKTARHNSKQGVPSTAQERQNLAFRSPCQHEQKPISISGFKPAFAKLKQPLADTQYLRLRPYRFYHYKMTKIHRFIAKCNGKNRYLGHDTRLTPFRLNSGNGRIGRILMNHILWNNGYPLLITEYAKMKRYYPALERSEESFRN